MDSVPEDFELNGELHPGSLDSPDARVSPQPRAALQAWPAPAPRAPGHLCAPCLHLGGKGLPEPRASAAPSGARAVVPGAPGTPAGERAQGGPGAAHAEPRGRGPGAAFHPAHLSPRAAQDPASGPRASGRQTVTSPSSPPRPRNLVRDGELRPPWPLLSPPARPAACAEPAARLEAAGTGRPPGSRPTWEPAPSRPVLPAVPALPPPLPAPVCAASPGHGLRVTCYFGPSFGFWPPGLGARTVAPQRREPDRGRDWHCPGVSDQRYAMLWGQATFRDEDQGLS